MATKTRTQIGLEDKIIKNEELEALLEKRLELKKSVSEFRGADKKAKAKIATIIEPMPYRIGRFIISSSDIPAKSVSFDTDAGKRIIIKTADES